MKKQTLQKVKQGQYQRANYFLQEHDIKLDSIDKEKKIQKKRLDFLKQNLREIKKGDFECKNCQVKFSDSLSHLEHLNSRVHQFNEGKNLLVQKCDLSDIKNALKNKTDQQDQKITKQIDQQSQEQQIKEENNIVL